PAGQAGRRIRGLPLRAAAPAAADNRRALGRAAAQRPAKTPGKRTLHALTQSYPEMNRTPTLPRILSSLGLALLLATAGSAQDNCGAYAGTISVDEGPVCLQNGQALLSGTPSSDAAVPPGFASTYLLTRTNGLI